MCTRVSGDDGGDGNGDTTTTTACPRCACMTSRLSPSCMRQPDQALCSVLQDEMVTVVVLLMVMVCL